MKIRVFVIALATLYATACATTDDVDSLEYSIYKIERAILKIAEHQTTLDDQFAALYEESESEISNIKAEVTLLRQKTEGIEFIPNEGGSLVVPSDTATKQGRVVLSLSRTSFWENSGGKNRQHPRNHTYFLDVEEAGNATIDLFSSISPSIDTFLYLLTETGSEITYDDDDGDGSHARIVHKLEPGRYRIIAATYRPGVNASYVLKVEGIKGRLVSPKS